MLPRGWRVPSPASHHYRCLGYQRDVRNHKRLSAVTGSCCPAGRKGLICFFRWLRLFKAGQVMPWSQCCCCRCRTLCLFILPSFLATKELLFQVLISASVCANPNWAWGPDKKMVINKVAKRKNWGSCVLLFKRHWESEWDPFGDDLVRASVPHNSWGITLCSALGFVSTQGLHAPARQLLVFFHMGRTGPPLLFLVPSFHPSPVLLHSALLHALWVVFKLQADISRSVEPNKDLAFCVLVQHIQQGGWPIYLFLALLKSRQLKSAPSFPCQLSFPHWPSCCFLLRANR